MSQAVQGHDQLIQHIAANHYLVNSLSDSLESGNDCPPSSTGQTLLPSLSTSRQATGSQTAAVSTVPPAADPRRHSAVCCCRLCEQRGTGEQAMRSVGGHYQRFLARLDRR